MIVNCNGAILQYGTYSLDCCCIWGLLAGGLSLGEWKLLGFRILGKESNCLFNEELSFVCKKKDYL